ncbi:zinc finger MYM-type protein 1-like [Tachysurus ichikawai]
MDIRKWFASSTEKTAQWLSSSMTNTADENVDAPVIGLGEGRATGSNRNNATTCPDDLGIDGPMQVVLSMYPKRLFGTKKRGKIEAFDQMDEGGSGLFMSLLEFSIRKDPQLAQIVKTIPKKCHLPVHKP